MSGWLKHMLIVVMPVLAFSSCTKEQERAFPVDEPKEYTCSYAYLYQNEEVVFKGYVSSELNQVVLQQFKAGSNYSELTASDTLDASGAVFTGDTACLTAIQNYHRGFFSLRDSIDYKITVVNTGRQYKISLKRGDASKTWTQSSPCSPGASQARIIPFYAVLNGQDYEPYGWNFPSPYPYFICLIR